MISDPLMDTGTQTPVSRIEGRDQSTHYDYRRPMAPSARPFPSPDAAIETRELVRRFGKVTALDGLSLYVARGAAYGLIGNNGAGKTTVIHSLLGFLPPQRGEMRVLGLQPGKDSLRIRQRVGFFSERDEPYEWMRVRTVLKMASLAYAQWDWALCQKLRERFCLDPRKRVKELSKGMAAKLKPPAFEEGFAKITVVRVKKKEEPE